MHIFRMVLSGVLLWLMVLVFFTAANVIPIIKDSPITQNLILMVFIIGFALWCVLFYYKRGKSFNGLIVGTVMGATGLILDALFTVPVLMQPQGIGYLEFYTDPFLYLLILETIIIAFLTWKTKVVNYEKG